MAEIWCKNGKHKLTAIGKCRECLLASRKRYYRRIMSAAQGRQLVDASDPIAVMNLVRAARAAKSCGMWRGKEAMSALKYLVSALEPFGDTDSVHMDNIEPYVDRCSCPSWPCAAHPDDANPADAEIA